MLATATTPDTMSTITSVIGSRARATSLSLTLSLSLHSRDIRPTLETLPTEILLRIATIVFSTPRPSYWNHVAQGHKLGRRPRSNSDSSSSDDDEDTDDALEYWALDRSSLCALALTSRIVSAIAHAVLYHTVQLNEVRPLELFVRTARTLRRPNVREGALMYRIPFNSGKETTRLVLDLPAFDEFLTTSSRLTPRERRTLEQQTRLYAAASSVLGLNPPSASAPSPSVLFDSLRTLVVPSEVLSQALRTNPMRAFEEGCATFPSPTPSELILDTYVPLPSQMSLSGKSSPLAAHLSPLARLGSALTHLSIATPPKHWSLPSETLAALGGAPALTHLAVVRRANANGDNDTEFVNDLKQILDQRVGTLESIVVAVLPDSTFRRWKAEQQKEKESENAVDVMEMNAELDPHSTLDPSIHVLEAYLSATDIWKSLSSLALAYPLSKHTVRPSVHVIPGSGDAWERATGKRSCGYGHTQNIYLDTYNTKTANSNGDFWIWARRYDEGRRAREAYAAAKIEEDTQ